ncbi:hypothetical protein DM860_011270 [Cuscuta australis]|uniref:Uncharacterized protein n=1 Tax=Cuscuta australis TaxID=267555 RepID=A0A328DPE2_9ASTE|nr:hypothetical protein DM860_011270 [Cuscuta australis]
MAPKQLSGSQKRKKRKRDGEMRKSQASYGSGNLQERKCEAIHPNPRVLENLQILSSRPNLRRLIHARRLLLPGGGGSYHDYDKLKESLARALSVWYPLAGRARGDGSSIVECNDKGVDFVRTNVTNFDLAEFLRRPEQPLLRQLFPRNPYPVAFDPTQPMLAVQVNRFKCGGTAVAICLWHGLADGAALSGFIQTWAEINRDQRSPTAVPQNSVVADAAAVFPPAKIDVTDDYVRKMFEGGGYLKTLVDERGGDDNQFFSISTWFKFECLKVDLGWGKPTWLGLGNNLDDLALLLDDVDGGIEAWIGLQPQVGTMSFLPMYLLVKLFPIQTR